MAADLNQSELELSVIVPTFNRQAALREMLPNALSQAADLPVEFLIVDDGSCDGTWAWLQDKYPDNPRVRCFRSERNRGPGAARNIGISRSKGRFFLPLDSDCTPLNGAFESVLEGLLAQKSYDVLFFPCLAFPGERRMDKLRGTREVTHDDLLYGRISSELIPIARIEHLREHGLSYPELKAGGEGILWVRAIQTRPALFIDKPILLYRTDSRDRICSLEYQLRNAAAVAAVSDAILELFPAGLSHEGRAAKAARLMAAGTYHLLAGNTTCARRRFRDSYRLGNKIAAALLVASLFGTRACRAAFRLLRPDPGV